MWQYQQTNELYHHGILNQKWGLRRFQNKDGSLTPAGKERYNKNSGKDSNTKLSKKQNSKKSIKDYSNEELNAMTNRLNAENNYREALKRNRSAGEKFINHIGTKILLPAVTNVAKNRVEKYLNQVLDDMIKKEKKEKKGR